VGDEEIDLQKEKIMSLQKYRADQMGEKLPNGSVPWYANWAGGPSLALVRNCPIETLNVSARTAYVRGEADTFFSIPAAVKIGGGKVVGYLTTNDNGYVFRHYKDSIIVFHYRGMLDQMRGYFTDLQDNDPLHWMTRKESAAYAKKRACKAVFLHPEPVRCDKPFAEIDRVLKNGFDKI
jgi:hypothetical protein